MDIAFKCWFLKLILSNEPWEYLVDLVHLVPTCLLHHFWASQIWFPACEISSHCFDWLLFFHFAAWNRVISDPPLALLLCSDLFFRLVWQLVWMLVLVAGGFLTLGFNWFGCMWGRGSCFFFWFLLYQMLC